jgi:hypothetical protein
MPADEFSSWLAYFEIEPFGTHGLEVLFARLLQTQYACAGAKSIPPADDLMPFVAYRKSMIGVKQKTAEELMQTFSSFTATKIKA